MYGSRHMLAVVVVDEWFRLDTGWRSGYKWWLDTYDVVARNFFLLYFRGELWL